VGGKLSTKTALTFGSNIANKTNSIQASCLTKPVDLLTSTHETLSCKLFYRIVSKISNSEIALISRNVTHRTRRSVVDENSRRRDELPFDIGVNGTLQLMMMMRCETIDTVKTLTICLRRHRRRCSLPTSTSPAAFPVAAVTHRHARYESTHNGHWS